MRNIVNQRNQKKQNKNQKRSNGRVFNFPKGGNKNKKQSNTAPIQQDDMKSYGEQIKSITENGYGKTLMMTPSTARFAQVYADPFIEDSARLPVFPLVSSQLTRTYASGKGVINANGNAWVMILPAGHIANDQADAVVYTNLSTAPDTFELPGGSFTGIATASSNSEFTTSQFVLEAGNSNKAFRLVAQGIRVRYLGTTLNAAGTCYTLQMSPKTVADDLIGFGVSDIKTYPGFKEYTFKDTKWHSLTRHITCSEDFFYQGYSNDTTAYCYQQSDNLVSSFDSQWNMGIYMTGTAGGAYEFEVVSHFEVVGPNLNRRGIVKADTAGVQKVTSAYSELRHKDTITQDHSVGKPPAASGGWLDVLKRGAEMLLPMIPKVLAMLL
jgi:hypothetical protein